VIEGHADERGTREYNLALGARRAAAVRDYMIAHGVQASRMRTISYGKERPVAVCDDISCWSQNRRAVTVLQGTS
jgi:peptidoglycan-associated lipoprotein